jgi:glycosyltransferase involved in cell wall biosynthesis
MKILMFTPYLPYPDTSGGQIRTQNLLKHLKKKHEITLFSLIKYQKEEQYIPILEKNFCKKVRVFYRPEKPWMLQNILRTGFSLDPFLVVRNFSPDAKKAVEAELKDGDYDLIHAETFYAMPHIPKTNLPVVLVDQTIEYKVYDHYVNNTAPFFIRPLLTIDVAKLKYWERYYWRQADKVIAVSEKDKEEMLAIEPGIDVEIVPNGVNLDLFKKTQNWANKPPVILISNNFKWLQNIEAAKALLDEIFPLVKKEVPDARVIVVGQHIPESIRRYAGSDVEIRSLREDDIDGTTKAYAEATVFASPVKGPGGTRLKNLAAMACQLPMVTTSVGIAGLGALPGRDILVGDDSETFSRQLIEIMKNPKLGKKLGENSRKIVEGNYDYEKIAEKLSQIYLSLKK